MNGFNIHLFYNQVDELIQTVPIDDVVLDGKFEERTDLYSELTLELDSSSEIAQKFYNNNRVLLQLPNGEFREFIMYEPDTDSERKTVRFNATYLELEKAKIIRPFSTADSQTVIELLTTFLEDTEWNIGDIEFAGIRPYSVSEYVGAYTAIRNLADFFGLNIRFRIEYENGTIKRYVDMAFEFGTFKGVELTDDNGLTGVRIKESLDVVTALVCVGVDTNGNALEVIVTDEKARQIYGRYANHLWGIYEVPERNITEYQAQWYGERELAKLAHKTIEIQSEQIDMYALTGNEYDRLDLWDFVRIISYEHKPTLRLQARVIGIVQSIVDPSDRALTLGEFIEYS